MPESVRSSSREGKSHLRSAEDSVFTFVKKALTRSTDEEAMRVSGTVPGMSQNRGSEKGERQV